MADNTENEVTNTDENRTNDTVTETGGGTTSEQKVEKTLTQQQVDAIVKQAKLDAKAAAKREIEKNYEGKLVLTEDEYTSRVNAALEAFKNEQALTTVKSSIKAEYGLSDEQVSRLVGDNEKALKADAEKLFGVFKDALNKKEAPRLIAGGTNIAHVETSVVSRLRDKLQKDLDNSKKK